MALVIPALLVTHDTKEIDSGVNKPLDQTKIEIGEQNVTAHNTNDRHNRINPLLLGKQLQANGVHVYFNSLGDSSNTLETRKRDTVSRELGIRSRAYQSVSANPFPIGWCTYWAKEKRPDLRVSGNAKDWQTNSQEARVGEIVKTRESRLGHVAYIERVEGDRLYISEMNYGVNIVRYRTININDKSIVGYIN